MSEIRERKDHGRRSTSAATSNASFDHAEERPSILLSFFHLLWLKQSEKGDLGTTLPHREGVTIPDTIIYESTPDDRTLQPTYWYFTKKDSTGVARKEKRRSKDQPTIVKAFCSQEKYVRSSDVVARWVHQRVDGCITVDYLDQEGLEKFLNGPLKEGQLGMLQKFVHPTGENSQVIHAVWSPRGCKVARSMNPHGLYTEVSPNIKCSTFGYDGESTSSLEILGALFPARVGRICEGMASHIRNVSEGVLNIVEMSVYFTLDRRNRLILMHCDHMASGPRGLDTLPPMRAPQSMIHASSDSSGGRGLARRRQFEYSSDEQPTNDHHSRIRPVDHFKCPRCQLWTLPDDVVATPIGNIIEDFERCQELLDLYPELRLEGVSLTKETPRELRKLKEREMRRKALFGNLEEVRTARNNRKAEQAKGDRQVEMCPVVSLMYPNMTVEEYTKQKKRPMFLLGTVELCLDCSKTVSSTSTTKDRPGSGSIVMDAKDISEGPSYGASRPSQAGEEVQQLLENDEELRNERDQLLLEMKMNRIHHGREESDMDADSDVNGTPTPQRYMA